MFSREGGRESSLLPLYDDNKYRKHQQESRTPFLLAFALGVFFLTMFTAPELFHPAPNSGAAANNAGAQSASSLAANASQIARAEIKRETYPAQEVGWRITWQELSADEEMDLMLKRRDAVKEAFQHAWSGYEKYAFGHDEIRPVTNATNDSWGRWGVTLFDALDTMILMGLDAEVARARKHVAQVNWDVDNDVSFFETAIRYLGGLLGAFELSRDKLYLSKAQQLADRLIASFEGTRTGLPHSIVNMRTGHTRNHQWNGGASILAEVGSIQLEFAYLSHHTKNNTYHEKARTVFYVLDSLKKDKVGLYPVYIDPDTGDFTGLYRITMGSLADSFYEYLLKLYLLSGHEDHDVLKMYNEATEGLVKHLLHLRLLQATKNDGPQTTVREYAFIGELAAGGPLEEQEHLACFVPGMLALGAATARANTRQTARSLSLEEQELTDRADRHMFLAKQLAATCADTYFETSTGLGPESISFSRQSWGAKPFAGPGQPHALGVVFDVVKPKYILRPETIESLFVLYRATGERKYREWGWTIFQSLQKHCRTPSSYSGLKDVDARPREHGEANWDNSMQSFFFAETLKYFYLLFSPPDLIPLDKYVFNTEAHPLGVLPSYNNEKPKLPDFKKSKSDFDRDSKFRDKQ